MSATNALPALESLIALDVETGGLDPDTNALLTVGLFPVGVEHLGYELQIQPELKAWTAEALNVNGIDLAAHARDESTLSRYDACRYLNQIAETYEHLIPGRPTLLGHNVAFDIAFIRAMFRDSKITPHRLWSYHRTVDTHSLLWTLHALGEVPSEALSSSGGFAHFGIELADGERHTATGDCKATAELLRVCLEKLRKRKPVKRTRKGVTDAR